MAGINAGAPSDRLLAEWMLDAPAVIARAAGQTPPEPDVTGCIALHPDFGALLDRNPQVALAERLRQRAEITAAFARGEEIAGLDRARGDYLLARRTGA
jgi:predicted GNAT superfamily acetyltransferase